MAAEKIPSYLHIHFIDRIAFLNGLISGLALFPQAFKVFITHSTADLSLLSIILIFINSLVWVAYAIHRGLISVIISALLNTIATSILLLAYCIF